MVTQVFDAAGAPQTVSMFMGGLIQGFSAADAFRGGMRRLGMVGIAAGAFGDAVEAAVKHELGKLCESHCSE
jgi:hypothetical protein